MPTTHTILKKKKRFTFANDTRHTHKIKKFQFQLDAANQELTQKRNEETELRATLQRSAETFTRLQHTNKIIDEKREKFF